MLFARREPRKGVVDDILDIVAVAIFLCAAAFILGVAIILKFVDQFKRAVRNKPT